MRPSARTVWLLLLLAIVTYLIIIPVGMVIYGSFKSTPAGVPGHFTLDNYRQGFSGSSSFLPSIRNSFVFAGASSVLAFGMGTYLAWLTERTDTPLRKLIYAGILVPVVVPGVLTTIAWVLILNKTIGLANWALALFGIAPFFDAYTMAGMVWADATDSITIPFLLMAAAFRTMDPSLEEASTTSGASNAHTLRRITLPLMTPAVLATFLLIFVKTLDSFETPAVMGLPGGIKVFATEVWLATSTFPTNHNLAAAFAVAYMAVAAFGLVLYYKATNVAEKFATITGKGYKPVRMKLGRRLRFVHLGVALTILFISVLLPFVVMVYASLMPIFSVPNADVFARMSFTNYEWVLGSPIVRRALKNNLIAGLGAATVIMILSALISWVVIRTRIRGRQLLDAVGFAPIVIPGIVLGLALAWLYLVIPVPIYATLWIIAIAFVAAYMPYGLRATHASLSQVGRELEEASATCGASFRRTFRSIILPLMTSGMLVGFIYVFSRTFKGLSLPIMLSGPRTEVLSVLVYDLYTGGFYTRLNALGVLMFVFLALMAAIAQRLAKSIGYLETG